MCTRGPIIGYQCPFVTFVDDLEVKTASKDLVEDLCLYSDQISFLGSARLKFNRSQFEDMTDPCSRTGVFHAELNKSRYNRHTWLDNDNISIYVVVAVSGQQHCWSWTSATRLWSPTRPLTASSRSRLSSWTSRRSTTMTMRTLQSWCSTSITATEGEWRWWWGKECCRPAYVSCRQRRLRWISSPTASHKWPFQFRRWIFVVS